MQKTNLLGPLPLGLAEAAAGAGILMCPAPNGIYADDAVAAQSFAASFFGSAAELQWWQQQRQTALDALFDAHFDLAKFIRGGTVTTITATQVGSFLAQIANNYRSLRASIAAATTVAAVQAINITVGWPSNP